MNKGSKTTVSSSSCKYDANNSNLNIVIDKMHFKGHIDSWCKEYCNPNAFEILNGVSPCVIIL